MQPPRAAMPRSPLTPLEPLAAHSLDLVAQATVCSTAFRRIEAAVAGSCGSQHDCNEDAHSPLDPSGTVFVVADGVGGGAMAQLASRQLVAHLHAALESTTPDAALVRRAMLDADRAIARRIAQACDAPGAATVALCAPVDPPASKWLVAWVGDCRVYRLALRGPGGIELLTRDDTFEHLGEQPPPGGALDDPARMVGNGATAGANVALHDLAYGEMLVLCSDGVHRYLGDDVWCEVLARGDSLARRCAALIARARAQGSTDDATVLVVHRGVPSLPRPRPTALRGSDLDSGRNGR